jgi:hypothetical protein
MGFISTPERKCTYNNKKQVQKFKETLGLMNKLGLDFVSTSG